MTIPGNRSTLRDDLYILLVDWQPVSSMGATFKIFVNPLVNWLWIGSLLFLCGVIIAAWPDKDPERRTSSCAQACTPDQRGGLMRKRSKETVMKLTFNHYPKHISYFLILLLILVITPTSIAFAQDPLPPMTKSMPSPRNCIALCAKAHRWMSAQPRPARIGVNRSARCWPMEKMKKRSCSILWTNTVTKSLPNRQHTDSELAGLHPAAGHHPDRSLHPLPRAQGVDKARSGLSRPGRGEWRSIRPKDEYVARLEEELKKRK